jgi:hypothetical protein
MNEEQANTYFTEVVDEGEGSEVGSAPLVESVSVVRLLAVVK